MKVGDNLRAAMKQDRLGVYDEENLCLCRVNLEGSHTYAYYYSDSDDWVEILQDKALKVGDNVCIIRPDGSMLRLEINAETQPEDDNQLKFPFDR